MLDVGLVRPSLDLGRLLERRGAEPQRHAVGARPRPPGERVARSVDAAAAFVADLLGAEPRVRQRLDADCSGVLCLGASAAGDAALRDAAPSYLALVDDEPARAAAARGACSICLLYTSDAADE